MNDEKIIRINVADEKIIKINVADEEIERLSKEELAELIILRLEKALRNNK